MEIQLKACFITQTLESIQKAISHPNESLEDFEPEALTVLANLRDIEFEANHQQLIEGRLGTWYCRKLNRNFVLVITTEKCPISKVNNFYKEFESIQSEFDKTSDEQSFNNQVESLVRKSNENLNEDRLANKYSRIRHQGQ